MRVVSTAFTTLALAVIFHTDLTDLTDIFYLTDFSDIVANPPYACQPNLCDL